MKRLIKPVLGLFLVLVLLSVSTAAFALADPEALVITDISVFQDAGDIILWLSLKNTGSEEIVEFGLALAFLDEDGMQIFGYDDTADGYAYEVCNWYYEPDEPFLAGGTYDTEDVFANYAGATEVAVAIRYYRLASGMEILLPESQWQWLFPGTETESGTLHREYYTSPSDTLYDTDGFFWPSYQYYLLDDFNAYYYGKNQGGEWITQITPGSPAALAGLRVGDLLLFVDGVKPTENIYAVDYAMAAIAAGEKVDWVYERDGVIYVTRLAK